VLRPEIAKSLPATTKLSSSAMSNVLYSLLQEETQLWVYFQKYQEFREPLAIITTTIMNDPISKARYLLIYSMTSVGEGKLEDYEKGLDILRTFAEEHNCEQLIAYVEDPRFIHILNKVGGVVISQLVRL
jgi:hypothetical protein